MKMRFKELESFTYIHTGSIKVEALQTPYFQISHSFYNSRQTSLSSRVLTSAHGFWWALNTSTDHTLTMILRVCVCVYVHELCIRVCASLNAYVCLSHYEYKSVCEFLCISVCVNLYSLCINFLSLSPTVCVLATCVHACICVSVCLPISLFIVVGVDVSCASVWLYVFVSVPVYLSVSLCVCVSIRMCGCLSGFVCL